MQKTKILKVLFLCTGNSCRSQMAEGWARQLRGDVIEAYSAGVNPSVVSRRAIKAMAEAGVDISKHRSKHVDEFKGIDFDYVVSVCDNAKEQCPVFIGKTRRVHVSFEDPADAAGSEAEVMQVFRKVRDEIKSFVEKLPEFLEKT